MAEDNTAEPAEREDDVFAVRVRVTAEQAAELIREEYDYGDRPHVTENPDGTGLLDLFVDVRQIEELRSRGLEVEVASNQSARARQRRSEVGEGDRFEGGRIPPRGLGRKISKHGPRRGSEEAP
ncbi:MAG TPA: hypothetical protein VLA91_11360 [Acidimicrobiia bacterium]|nr:hypothetical protein [Acidimicrobiia bacterium]